MTDENEGRNTDSFTPISAQSKLNDKVITVAVDVDLGSDLGDAIDKFGQEVVFAGFVTSATNTVQAAIRNSIKNGKTPEQIQERLNGWKPGVKLARETVSPLAAAKRLLAEMSDKDRMAALEELGLA